MFILKLILNVYMQRSNCVVCVDTYGP